MSDRRKTRIGLPDDRQRDPPQKDAMLAHAGTSPVRHWPWVRGDQSVSRAKKRGPVRSA